MLRVIDVCVSVCVYIYRDYNLQQYHDSAGYGCKVLCGNYTHWINIGIQNKEKKCYNYSCNYHIVLTVVCTGTKM